MKISVSREVLLPALQAAGNVVDRRQSMQILGNFLLSAKGDELSVTASDLEVEVAISCRAEIGREGSATLPAKKLLDICRSLAPDSILQIDVSGGKGKVQSGRSRFSLGVLPSEDFPTVEGFSALTELEVDSQVLTDLISSTQFAMAHQDVRYYLNGLLLELSASSIRAVATDGHRLALCDRDLPTGLTGPVQVIVPRKAVQEIQRMLGHHEGLVKVILGENHISVQSTGQLLIAKLVDGKFPDYQRVIPKQGEKIVVANREAVKAAFSRTSILSNEKFRGVRLVLSKDLLRAMTNNPEQEEAEVDIEVEYDGADLEIGFNVSYLLDVLSVLKSASVRVELSDANSSSVIYATDDERAKYVIMPMRL